ncbi:NRDE family protein [Akkermansiaceae bacterium]|nr:NRDE family protein [Akkermansiaceae bacterium]
MCTLTWWRDRSGALEIYFNRDERKTRPIADPPALRELNGLRFLSPRDPKGGGTWMTANELGMVVCLLNKWELEGRATLSPKSRGELVWQMAAISSLDEVEDHLENLESYPAFTLVVFSSDGERRWDWDGKELTRSEAMIPVTSSSFCFEEVKAAREGAFASGKRGEDYHSSKDEPSSAYTVRMNRPDAQTWSRSRLVVGAEIVWEYFAEQADLAGEAKKTVEVLPRR